MEPFDKFGKRRPPPGAPFTVIELVTFPVIGITPLGGRSSMGAGELPKNPEAPEMVTDRTTMAPKHKRTLFTAF
jgi:hypothetical protein